MAQKIDSVIEMPVVQPSVPVCAVTRFLICASMRPNASAGTIPLRSASCCWTTAGSATSPQMAMSAAMPGNSASMVKQPPRPAAAMRPRLRSSMVGHDAVERPPPLHHALPRGGTATPPRRARAPPCRARIGSKPAALRRDGHRGLRRLGRGAETTGPGQGGAAVHGVLHSGPHGGRMAGADDLTHRPRGWNVQRAGHVRSAPGPDCVRGVMDTASVVRGSEPTGRAGRR